MSCYEPCPACNRHVVTDEKTCPFCAAPLPECFSEVKRKPLRGRMSRAGLFAAGAGAALISASCTQALYGASGMGGTSGSMSAGTGGTGGAAGAGGTTGTGGEGGAPVAEYGAPPAFVEPETEPKPNE